MAGIPQGTLGREKGVVTAQLAPLQDPAAICSYRVGLRRLSVRCPEILRDSCYSSVKFNCFGSCWMQQLRYPL